MAEEVSGDEWVRRAKARIETAVMELSFGEHVTGQTKSTLWRAYVELEAACQHLLDAGFAYGVGDLR